MDDLQYVLEAMQHTIPNHDSTEIVEWGSLPLGWYMIEHWSPNTKPYHEQRLRLMRDFVALGAYRRIPYREKAEQNSIPPESSQVSHILGPLRSPAVRAVAKAIPEMHAEFIWFRTDYSNEEGHNSLLEHVYDETANMSYIGVVLSEKRFYDWADQWHRIFDVLPEILSSTAYGNDEPFDAKWLGDEYLSLNENFLSPPDDLDLVMQYAYLTDMIHVREMAQFLCVEDAQTYTTDPPTFLGVLLDDRGALMRQMRLVAEEAESFLCPTTVHCDVTVLAEAEPEPDYLPGGCHGPPPGSIAYRKGVFWAWQGRKKIPGAERLLSERARELIEETGAGQE